VFQAILKLIYSYCALKLKDHLSDFAQALIYRRLLEVNSTEKSLGRIFLLVNMRECVLDNARPFH
jgi:hypothetical protein